MFFTINPTASAADDLLASMLLSASANGIPGSTSVAPVPSGLASVEPRSFADFLISQQAAIKTGDPVQNVKHSESASGTFLKSVALTAHDTETESKVGLIFALPLSGCDGKKAACPHELHELPELVANAAVNEEPVGRELAVAIAPVHLPSVSHELPIASTVLNHGPVIQQPAAIEGYTVPPDATAVKSTFRPFPETAVVKESGQPGIRQDLKVTAEVKETIGVPAPRMDVVGTSTNLDAEGDLNAPVVQPQTPIPDKTSVQPLATEFAAPSPHAAAKSTVPSNPVVRSDEPVEKISPELPIRQPRVFAGAVSNANITADVTIDVTARVVANVTANATVPSALTASANFEAPAAPEIQAAQLPEQGKIERPIADLALPQGKLADSETAPQSLPPVFNRPVPAPGTVAERPPVQPALALASYGQPVPVVARDSVAGLSRASEPELPVGEPAPTLTTPRIPVNFVPAGSREQLPVDHGKEPGFMKQVSEKENPEIGSAVEGVERWIPASADRAVRSFAISGYPRDQFPSTVLASPPPADRQRTADVEGVPVRGFDRQVSASSLVSAAPVMQGRDEVRPTESIFQQLGADFTGKERVADPATDVDDVRRHENPASRSDFPAITAGGTGPAREAAGTPIFANDGADETVFESRVLPKVLESIDFSVSEGQARDGGIDRVRIALDPPGLGELALEVSRSENGFRVLIVADRASTHALLEQNIEVLESTLELTHGGVEVDVSRRHSRDHGPYPGEQMWGHPIRSGSSSPVEIPAPRRSWASAGGVDLFV